MTDVLLVLGSILFAVLLVAGIFCTLTGMAWWVFIMRANRAPMDKSNRIAHLGLCWTALREPHEFVQCKVWDGDPETGGWVTAFPELTMDVGEMRKELNK